MNEIMKTIQQIHLRQERITAAVLKAHGKFEIGVGQLRIMQMLWKEDNLRQVDLAERVGIKKTTLSSMLPKLMELGYVAQVEDEYDRRAFRIVLTEKGKDLKEHHKKGEFRLDQKYFIGIDSETLEVLSTTLNIVLENMARLEECFVKMTKEE